jgi:hypothetical protein
MKTLWDGLLCWYRAGYLLRWVEKTAYEHELTRNVHCPYCEMKITKINGSLLMSLGLHVAHDHEMWHTRELISRRFWRRGP